MISLRLYYIWFFIICLASTLLAGVLAAILPNSIGGVLTAIPYLIAIIVVLFKFLKKQRRAPTVQEKKRLTIGFSLIFWGYNACGLLLGLLIFARKDPEIWQIFLLYLKQPQFLLTVLAMWFVIAVPLFLITYWFYGPQAQRMANKMF
ncbi:ABZJ_00895 family protein [Acinetobacter sp. ANC 3882]|uniref:ABZJ_00895 family protein n=1 Tax=Acinetobacter sp. ANC 3882 TaxID=2923423 RepID=UPI001F4B9576|nr:ABZJ_00895 family protein [Acinetobacter sp. ANC 3882]MCH7315528.1 ABZJ_00895 family protein [Acinetobacter sp. ANC 3882]